MNKLVKAGARLVSRLVPEADADAVCGYWTQNCTAYPGACRPDCNQIGQCTNHSWMQQCGWCSDGSSYCGSCYKTSLPC